jgi:tetratricopeptide (TPR) repeat protein
MRAGENSRIGTKGVQYLVQGLLSLGLALAGLLTLTQAMAAWLATARTTEGLRRAIRLDSTNGRYHAQLARALQFSMENASLDEILKHYERAVSLEPHRAESWEELGAAYEWLGRAQDAQRAFERARELFPESPAVNWTLSNFYFRQGDLTLAFATTKRAIRGQPELRRAGFDLAWRATADANRILAEMLFPDAALYLEYIAYLCESQRMEAAAQAWARLLELGLPFEPQAASGYLDALLQQRRVDELEAAWEALASRHPTVIPTRRGQSNLIVNGSFESDILNGGLDWRIAPLEGVEVAADHLIFFDGASSLRIRFDGRRNPDFLHVLQFVPVTPETNYRLSAFLRAEGITSDRGLFVQAFDADDEQGLFRATAEVVGTQNWAAQELLIRTREKTRLLVVRLARLHSEKLNGQIPGTVWVDRITLQKAD